jgi:hypothetical protein
MMISRSVLLRIRNVSDKVCRGNQNAFCVQFFFLANPAVYEKSGEIWYSLTEKLTIWRMRIACWIPKTTDTHSEYVILFALPQQQLLHARASMSRYTYIACLVL